MKTGKKRTILWFPQLINVIFFFQKRFWPFQCIPQNNWLHLLIKCQILWYFPCEIHQKSVAANNWSPFECQFVSGCYYFVMIIRSASKSEVNNFSAIDIFAWFGFNLIISNRLFGLKLIRWPIVAHTATHTNGSFIIICFLFAAITCSSKMIPNTNRIALGQCTRNAKTIKNPSQVNMMKLRRAQDNGSSVKFTFKKFDWANIRKAIAKVLFKHLEKQFCCFFFCRSKHFNFVYLTVWILNGLSLNINKNNRPINKTCALAQCSVYNNRTSSG